MQRNAEEKYTKEWYILKTRAYTDHIGTIWQFVSIENVKKGTRLQF